MDQQLAFVREHARGHWPMGVLCAQYGISEKTGYEWVARFAAGGPAALADRSHATHHCPHRLDARLTDALLQLRQQHPRWGPRQLVAYLRARRPDAPWPAASTVGAPLATDRPNQVWTADFKGECRTGDGAYCDPLPSVTPTRATCSPAARSTRCARRGRGPSSRGSFTSTGCPRRSAPTTATRSRRTRWGGSRP